MCSDLQVDDVLLVLDSQDDIGTWGGVPVDALRTGVYAMALVTTKDYTLDSGRHGSPVRLAKEVQVYTSIATTHSSMSLYFVP
jgi:hypothetical protein